MFPEIAGVKAGWVPWCGGGRGSLKILVNVNPTDVLLYKLRIPKCMFSLIKLL